jgi:hypothetical protein
MASHKNQHFIPRCYLKAWCDPHTPTEQTPYVWQFSKDGAQVRKKSPNNIFSETDMYTVRSTDGSRDLTLEKGLQELETRFSIVRDRATKREPSTPEDHFVLCAFTAAMHARTKVRREHHSKIWNQVLEQRERLAAKVNNLTPEQRRRIRPEPKAAHGSIRIPSEKVDEWATRPLQSWLSAEVGTLAPILSTIDLVLFETDDATGFITSDNPCVWFDPEACKRTPFYQTPALMYDTIEITLPLSPRQMLLFNRKGRTGRARLGESSVDELNRRTRFFAHEYFIVNSDTKKGIWFDRGVEPSDSWGNRRSSRASRS